MKHTIRGVHGHLYHFDMKKSEAPVRICISASDAAKTDLAGGELALRHKISKKYKTCWLCHVCTDRAGGFTDPGCKKVLFYECEVCDPRKKRSSR